MPLRSIVIVGAGTAGLASALACAAAGVRVVVFDSLPVARSCAAHVDVCPSLLRDLSRLGVAQDFVRRGFVYNGFSLVDEEGAEALRVPTPRLAGDQLPPALGISHDDFHSVLEAAAKSAGAEIRRGTHVQRVDARIGTVLTDRGEWVQSDLVVLAAGAGSLLVKSVFGAPVTGSPRQAWWHTSIARPQGVDRPVWMAGRSGRHLLVVPISMSRAGLAVRAEAAPTGGRAELAATLYEWGGFARRIVSAIDPAMPLALREVTGGLLDTPWYRDAVLCAGASAHAIPPPFGQSVAQGVEDGIVLGELVRAGLDRPVLLQRFMERRGERVAQVHALTSRAARWMSRPDPSADLMGLSQQLQSLVAEPA